MAKFKKSILALDDEEDILSTFASILAPEYSVFTLSDPVEALKKINKQEIDLVLLDIRMPQTNGIDVLKKIKQIDDTIEVIMVSALNDSKNAVAAMKNGAYDYINKPFDVDDLKALIKKALERRSLIKENKALKTAGNESFENIVGQSTAMKSLFEMIVKIAGSDATVLIAGETGTGKELIAKSIHKKSGRCDKPFIALNCAAIPESLFESELFGHERGSFTGANERHTGKFEMADGGTLFLDEIGCLPLSMQAKLLRVLQEDEIERVGGTKTIPINARLIGATNLDLKSQVAKKEFREDLFYRLNVIPVNIPPLRERGGDIGILASHFLEKFNKKLNKKILNFNGRVLEALKLYSWPGNVRELENIIERMATLTHRQIIEADDLPKELLSPFESLDAGLKDATDDFERVYIKKALDINLGSQTKAAQMLKIDRTTLISKMKKLL